MATVGGRSTAYPRRPLQALNYATPSASFDLSSDTDSKFHTPGGRLQENIPQKSVSFDEPSSVHVATMPSSATRAPTWSSLLGFKDSNAQCSPVTQRTSISNLSTDVDSMQQHVDTDSIEAMKSELLSTIRNVDHFISRVASACSTFPKTAEVAAADMLRKEVYDFTNNMQLHLQSLAHSYPEQSGEPNGLDTGPYEALRKSLVDAQDRCAALNDEMMRLADANEELMNTMQSVKSANRKHISEIQTQSDEIARLLRERLNSEQRRAELAQHHKVEMEEFEADVERRLQAQESESRAAFQTRRQQLVSTLRKMQDSARTLAVQAAGLRSMQVAASSEVKSALASWGASTFENLGRELATRVAQQCREDEAGILQLEDEAHLQTVRLGVEREARERDARNLYAQKKELLDEANAAAALAEATHAELRAELESAEMAREEQACRANIACHRCFENLRTSSMQAESMRAMAEVAKGINWSLEKQCAKGDAERRRTDEEAQAAAHNLRESDHALDQAVASNEHLRRQMESQRLDAQAKHRQAIELCKKQFELDHARLLKAHGQENENLVCKVEELQQAQAAKEVEVVKLTLAIEKRTRDRNALQRECASWKAQEELAGQFRTEVERELAEVHAAHGRLKGQLMEQRDKLTVKHLALEGNLRTCKEELGQFKKDSAARVAQADSRLRSLEAQAAETSEELAAAKQELQDKANALSAVQIEASANRTTEMEAQHSLEDKLRRLTQEAAETRERLTHEVEEGQQKVLQAEQELQELKSHGQRALQKERRAPITKFTSLERAIAELRSWQRAEAQFATLKVETNRKQIETLETEKAHLHRQLDDAEAELQRETAATKNYHAKQKDELSKLEENIANSKGKLQNTEKRTTALRSELEELRQASITNKAKEQEDMTRMVKHQEQQARVDEARLRSMRRQNAERLALAEDRMRSELEAQSRLLEAAQVENRRLRSMAGGSRVQ